MTSAPTTESMLAFIRWQTSLHEAGHLVIAKWVGLNSNGAAAGTFAGRASWGPVTPADDIIYILVLLGAAAAERLATVHAAPEAPPREPATATAEDRAIIATLATDDTTGTAPKTDEEMVAVLMGIFQPQFREDALGNLKTIASRVVREREDDVVAMATELFTAGTLKPESPK